MAKITFEGMADLKKALKEKVTLDDLKHTVRKHGGELQSKMQKNADFKMGYQTGATKRSIGVEIKDNDLTADVAPTTEYSQYLEFGTRFMEAQPFVKPAWEEQKELFKRDLDKLVR